ARDDAGQILCEAAAGGMALRDLAGLAEEIHQRSQPPAAATGDGEAERVFEDRSLRVGITFGAAGRAEGDLTPGCAHALTTVLDALGKKAGPEDTRTAGQRRHDALAEACRRLITAGMVPGRAGQPTQLTVHMTLAQLLGLPGGRQAQRAWAAAQATTRPGWLTGPEADAAACDATITPLVSGHLDPAALDRLTALFQSLRHTVDTDHGPGTSTTPDGGGPDSGGPDSGGPDSGRAAGAPHASGPGGHSRPASGQPPGTTA